MLEEQNDMVMLNKEAHGRYTTRSGYKYDMQELMRRGVMCKGLELFMNSSRAS